MERNLIALIFKTSNSKFHDRFIQKIYRRALKAPWSALIMRKKKSATENNLYFILFIFEFICMDSNKKELTIQQIFNFSPYTYSK